MRIDTYVVDHWPEEGFIITDYSNTYLLPFDMIEAQRNPDLFTREVLLLQSKLSFEDASLINITPQNDGSILVKWYQKSRLNIKTVLGQATLHSESSLLHKWIDSVVEKANVLQAIYLLRNAAIKKQENDAIVMKRFKDILNAKKHKIRELSNALELKIRAVVDPTSTNSKKELQSSTFSPNIKMEVEKPKTRVKAKNKKAISSDDSDAALARKKVTRRKQSVDAPEQLPSSSSQSMNMMPTRSTMIQSSSQNLDDIVKNQVPTNNNSDKLDESLHLLEASNPNTSPSLSVPTSTMTLETKTQKPQSDVSETPGSLLQPTKPHSPKGKPVKRDILDMLFD